MKGVKERTDSSPSSSPSSTRAGVELFRAQATEPSPSLVQEFVYFLRHSKKWWLTPILVVLGMIGLVVALGGTAAAPFIYSLF